MVEINCFATNCRIRVHVIALFDSYTFKAKFNFVQIPVKFSVHWSEIPAVPSANARNSGQNTSKDLALWESWFLSRKNLRTFLRELGTDNITLAISTSPPFCKLIMNYHQLLDTQLPFTASNELLLFFLTGLICYSLRLTIGRQNYRWEVKWVCQLCSRHSFTWKFWFRLVKTLERTSWP